MRLKITLFSASAFLLAAATLAAQGQMMDMNDMPYDSVKAKLMDPAQMQQVMAMAKKMGVVLMAGTPVTGKSVTLKGELADGNCYLSLGLRGHSHAMCAKACVAAGAPILFIGEQGAVYSVLTATDGVPLPKAAFDALGRPGVTVTGKEVTAHGVKAIAIESVQP